LVCILTKCNQVSFTIEMLLPNYRYL